MAKVLISFIGTGPLVNKGAQGEEKSAREYRRASYHWVKRTWVNTLSWRLHCMKLRI